jgi:hypothetical protein
MAGRAEQGGGDGIEPGEEQCLVPVGDDAGAAQVLDDPEMVGWPVPAA